MRHDWIFDVLSDLKAYAMAHGMVALAAKAEEALQIARLEVEQAESDPDLSAGKSPRSKLL